MLTNKQIKTLATKNAYKRVFDHYCQPRDIISDRCANGKFYIRRLWREPNGKFGWHKWEEYL